MMDQDALTSAFRDEKAVAKEVRKLRRQQRADRTLRNALSPARILANVLLVPVVTVALTISIYVRTSPYERQDAMRHLVAMSGCAAAAKVGLPYATANTPGYHVRNDGDLDGIACNEGRSRHQSAQAEPGTASPLPSGGAKFLRP